MNPSQDTTVIRGENNLRSLLLGNTKQEMQGPILLNPEMHSSNA